MKVCNNVKCDWFSEDKKWKCLGIPYLMKNTADCHDFIDNDKVNTNTNANTEYTIPILTNPYNIWT